VDARSVIPDPRANEKRWADQFLEQCEEEYQQRRRESLNRQSKAPKPPTASAPSANGANAKPAA
jgi:hypothetical protein